MINFFGTTRNRRFFSFIAIITAMFLVFSTFTIEAVAQKKKAGAKKSATKKSSSKKSVARKNSSRRKARNTRASRNRKSRSARNSRNARANNPTVPVEKGTPLNVEVIVSTPMSPIRSQASFAAPFIANAKLGTTLQAVEKSSQWYRVEYVVGGRTATGWIAANTVSEMNGGDRTDIYRQITDRNYRADMEFNTSVELYDFLGRVSADMPKSEKAADVELKRIFALRTAASKINRQNRNSAPFSEFIRQRDGEIVFNEASGEYLVSSNLFWNLADKYRNTPSGDIIGWYGARNPLPSECGRLVNCHVFLARMTDGEYLSIFPNGRSSNDAMRNISFLLEPLVTDSEKRSIFMNPTDADGKTELKSLIMELRTIVSRSGNPEKQNVLKKLDRIEEAYL